MAQKKNGSRRIQLVVDYHPSSGGKGEHCTLSFSPEALHPFCELIDNVIRVQGTEARDANLTRNHLNIHMRAHPADFDEKTKRLVVKNMPRVEIDQLLRVLQFKHHDHLPENRTAISQHYMQPDIMSGAASGSGVLLFLRRHGSNHQAQSEYHIAREEIKHVATEEGERIPLQVNMVLNRQNFSVFYIPENTALKLLEKKHWAKLEPALETPQAFLTAARNGHDFESTPSRPRLKGRMLQAQTDTPASGTPSPREEEEGKRKYVKQTFRGKHIKLPEEITFPEGHAFDGVRLKPIIEYEGQEATLTKYQVFVPNTRPRLQAEIYRDILGLNDEDIHLTRDNTSRFATVPVENIRPLMEFLDLEKKEAGVKEVAAPTPPPVSPAPTTVFGSALPGILSIASGGLAGVSFAPVIEQGRFTGEFTISVPKARKFMVFNQHLENAQPTQKSHVWTARVSTKEAQNLLGNKELQVNPDDQNRFQDLVKQAKQNPQAFTRQ